MRDIEIEAGGVVVRARLRETATAAALWAALPIRGRAMTWGDEIYFDSGVDCPREPDAKAVMSLGEIAYWPDGSAIAIGFGPTPVSRGDEIRLASPSNVWADALDDVRSFKSVRSGAAVEVRRAA